MAKTAFIFPGQGSQFVGMGKDFHDSEDWAKDLFGHAEAVTGKPIRQLCFDGPMEDLTRTVNLQPALTTVNMVCFEALRRKGLSPDYTAGHSLGEFSALAAAGAIEAKDAFRLVNRRGELMDRDASRRPGAMQAVIGLSREDVEAIAELARAEGIVVVANHNSPQQVVITGESAAVAAAAKWVKTKGGKAIPLAVSGAWHSPLMEGASRDFAEDIEKTVFKSPTCPVILNVTGEAETDPVKIKEIMIRQITSPVKWCDSVLFMLQKGVTAFIEVGPKNVLSGLVKKTAPAEASINIMNIQKIADMDKIVADVSAQRAGIGVELLGKNHISGRSLQGLRPVCGDMPSKSIVHQRKTKRTRIRRGRIDRSRAMQRLRALRGNVSGYRH